MNFRYDTEIPYCGPGNINIIISVAHGCFAALGFKNSKVYLDLDFPAKI